MSTLTLEATRGQAGEQSVAAQAAARGEAASPRVGRSTNPEVVAERWSQKTEPRKEG